MVSTTRRTPSKSATSRTRTAAFRDSGIEGHTVGGELRLPSRKSAFCGRGVSGLYVERIILLPVMFGRSEPFGRPRAVAQILDARYVSPTQRKRLQGRANLVREPDRPERDFQKSKDCYSNNTISPFLEISFSELEN